LKTSQKTSEEITKAKKNIKGKENISRQCCCSKFFLNFTPLKPDIIMLIRNGNSYLLGGK
jgi:hypothetical protein